jgi:hypothetical protein
MRVTAIVTVPVLAVILVATMAAPPVTASESRPQKATGIVRVVNTYLGYIIIEREGTMAIYVLGKKGAEIPDIGHIEGRQVTIEYRREFGVKVVTHIASAGNK